MSEQKKEFSKLCLAGFILTIMPLAIMPLSFLARRGFIVEKMMPAVFIFCPLAGFVISIAGLVTVRKNEKKGRGFGIAGVALPGIAMALIILIAGPLLLSTGTKAAKMRKNEMYSMGSLGKTENTGYDVSQFWIPEGYDFNSLNITVSETEFKSYAESKLQTISSESDKSIKGTYKNYNFLIIRSDRLDDWLRANTSNGFEYHNGYATISYEDSWEFAAYRQVFLAVYKDLSDKFIVITNCSDYKVISEFFGNG